MPINSKRTKLFYKSNRPHFLWVYRRDNPLRMLCFSRFLPTSSVYYHAGKPTERVVNCLNNTTPLVWPQPNFTRQIYTKVVTSNISQALIKGLHSGTDKLCIRSFLPLFLCLVSFQKTSAGPTGSTTIHRQLVTGILKPALAHALVQPPSSVRQLMGYQCLTLSLMRPRA